MQVVAQRPTDGASIAAVALAHGINANIVHRWLREHAASPPAKPVNLSYRAEPASPQVEQANLFGRLWRLRDIRVEIRVAQAS